MRRALTIFALSVLLVVSRANAAPGNLSGLASPSATPTPTQLQGNCQVQVQDTSAAPGKISTTGTIAVPADGTHVVNVRLIAPNALNTMQVNGTTPPTWTNVATGTNISYVVDVPGLWTFTVSSANCAPNTVSILGY